MMFICVPAQTEVLKTKQLEDPALCTHGELAQVFTFVRVLPGRLSSAAQLVVEPHQQVPHRLGAGDDVERRRQRAALVKVAHPQLGARELPLDVGVILQDENGGEKITVYQRLWLDTGREAIVFNCFFLLFL